MENINLSDESIEKIFNNLGYGVLVDDLVCTQGTIKDYKEACIDYQEHGGLKEGTEEGYSYLIIEKAQIRKGDTRKDIVVIDFGKKRLIYT